MLYWALAFVILALVAAFLGFSIAYSVAAGIAKLLFFVFLVAAVMIIVRRVAGRHRHPRL